MSTPELVPVPPGVVTLIVGFGTRGNRCCDLSIGVYGVGRRLHCDRGCPSEAVPLDHHLRFYRSTRRTEAENLGDDSERRAAGESASRGGDRDRADRGAEPSGGVCLVRFPIPAQPLLAYCESAFPDFAMKLELQETYSFEDFCDPLFS